MSEHSKDYDAVGWETRVLVSCRNSCLLQYGRIKPFCALSSAQQCVVLKGNVGVHVMHEGKLTKIVPANARQLQVERRKYWQGDIPLKTLQELMKTDAHYQKNRPCGQVAQLASLEYPVALEPVKSDQTLGDGYHRFFYYEQEGLQTVPAMAGVQECL